MLTFTVSIKCLRIDPNTASDTQPSLNTSSLLTYRDGFVGACVQISLEVTATSLEEVHWEEREGFGLQGAWCGEKRTGLEVSGQFQCSPSFATNVMCVTSGKQSILQASSFSSQYEGVRLTSKTLTSSYLP